MLKLIKTLTVKDIESPINTKELSLEIEGNLLIIRVEKNTILFVYLRDGSIDLVTACCFKSYYQVANIQRLEVYTITK